MALPVCKVFFLCVAIGVGAASVEEAPGPIVQVKLAPPTLPQPQVVAELAKLEQSREANEGEQMSALRLAYDEALAAAKVEIANVVGGMGKTVARTSFLSISGRKTEEDFAVRIHLDPVPPPDLAIKVQIDSLEGVRAAREKRVFQQALAEFAALTKIVVNQLKVELGMSPSSGMGFLEYGVLPRQANVRVLASDVGFPTIAGLVQDAQLHRDASEDAARSAILDLEMKLLQAENEVIAAALR